MELIGRARERERLAAAVAAARRADGGLTLVTGQAGVGKTRLVRDAVEAAGVRTLVAAGPYHATSYELIAQVLRRWVRDGAGDLAACGPLAPHLAHLVPELGPPPEAPGDRATLHEAIRHAFAALGAEEPTAVVFDDLHWADAETLDLLPDLLPAGEPAPLAIVGVYRNDELGGARGLRQLRAALHRSGRLEELVLDPLDAAATAALVAGVLGAAPSPALARLLHARTEGVPFFVEELTHALRGAGRLREGPRGVEMAGGSDVPVPATVQDAVLVRTDALSAAANAALEVAAVAGTHFDLSVVGELVDDAALADVFAGGLVVEVEPGHAAFRHALARDAVYANVPWTRRRSLHRRLAQRLEAGGPPTRTAAEHWLAGHEPVLARAAFRAAGDESRRLFAHRDAAHAYRRALDLWPQGEEEADRQALLRRLAECAELAGELADAAQALREVADGARRVGDVRLLGHAHRRLAGVYGIQGSSERAIASGLAAAQAFAACDQPADAAGCRLAAATLLQHGGQLTACLELLAAAAAEAARSDRSDLLVRTRTLEAIVRGKLGEAEAALELARGALSRALDERLTGPAAGAYQALAVILENAADYEGARSAYTAAIEFCEASGAGGVWQVCMGCLAHVLRQTGEWGRAAEVCRQLLETGRRSAGDTAAWCVATVVLGMVHACRGEVGPARTLVAEAAPLVQSLESIGPQMEHLWTSARLAEQAGEDEAVVDHCLAILGRWEETDDRHYSVQPLRWATTALALRGRPAEARRCAHALAAVAAGAGNRETLASLASALAETALLESGPEAALRHFDQAVELMRGVRLPCDRAEILLRAGVVAAAAGDRRLGVERLRDAYLSARKLGARPLAAAAMAELERLGERVTRRSGRRPAGEIQGAGLSVREAEIVRLIALGRTNREIAGELFLSTRTVDMHVRNALARLGCRSRVDAVRRAAQLGLVPAR